MRKSQHVGNVHHVWRINCLDFIKMDFLKVKISFCKKTAGNETVTVGVCMFTGASRIAG